LHSYIDLYGRTL